MRKVRGSIKSKKEASRYRRKLSIRNKIAGTAERPRICVNRSNKHILVQVIDDISGKTVASSQTFGKNCVEGAKANIAGGKLVGADIAEKLKKINVEKAVFDRNGFRYFGVIAAVASSARENGITI
jgi:large subunit ribosomal protein L18